MKAFNFGNKTYVELKDVYDFLETFGYEGEDMVNKLQSLIIQDDDDDDSIYRQMAAQLLNGSPLIGIDYYNMEDYYTKILKGEEAVRPNINSLKLFLYEEAEYRLHERGFEDIEPEIIEDLAEELYDNEFVIDGIAVEEIVENFIKENKLLKDKQE